MGYIHRRRASLGQRRPWPRKRWVYLKIGLTEVSTLLSLVMSLAQWYIMVFLVLKRLRKMWKRVWYRIKRKKYKEWHLLIEYRERESNREILCRVGQISTKLEEYVIYIFFYFLFFFFGVISLGGGIVGRKK